MGYFNKVKFYYFNLFWRSKNKEYFSQKKKKGIQIDSQVHSNFLIKTRHENNHQRELFEWLKMKGKRFPKKKKKKTKDKNKLIAKWLY